MIVFPQEEAWNLEYNKDVYHLNKNLTLRSIYSPFYFRFKEIWNTLKVRSKHTKLGHNAETDLTVQLTTSFHLGWLETKPSVEDSRH